MEDEDEIELLAWEGRRPPWALGPTAVLPREVGAAADALDRELDVTTARWLLFWDPLLGNPDPAEVTALAATGRADAWHAGLCFGLAGAPAEHDYIHPVWPLAHDGDPERPGASWRVSLAALLVRTDALRIVGGLDRAFGGLTGAGLELGRRLLDRGAVVVHTPDLVGDARRPAERLTDEDRFVFLRRLFSPKWVRYAALRRVLAGAGPLATARALRRSASAGAADRRPDGTGGAVSRDPAMAPGGAEVTVVLPTLGRYELVEPLLEALADQTVAPTQVVVVDQNEAGQRRPELYQRFHHLPLEVIFQEERGQWRARNAAIVRASGQWLAFVDDDSEIKPDFIEAHLEGLARYGADLSTGASLAVVGAPVPDNYGFFRVADQFDSGNGMAHRRLFERVGLFDEQFDRQRRGDAEFGLRVQLAGGLVIHNPNAVRTHLKSAEGGLRTFGSWDGFRHRDRRSPLPLPSMVYYTRRYHTPRQVREDLVIGLAQSIVPYHLKRRASAGQWLRFALAEVAQVPATVGRVRRSLRLAARMVDEGPRIPRLGP